MLAAEFAEFNDANNERLRLQNRQKYGIWRNASPVNWYSLSPRD